jgi:hypothetical protein
MNHNRYIKEIEKASFNGWAEIDDNIFIYKKNDGGIAVIHPNVSHFKEISEWQSQCYRLVNDVKIDGVSVTSNDIGEIRIELLKELDFLSSIIVPERVK